MSLTIKEVKSHCKFSYTKSIWASVCDTQSQQIVWPAVLGTEKKKLI